MKSQEAVPSPNAPVDLQIIETTDTTARVSWQPSEPQTLFYLVQYYSRGLPSKVKTSFIFYSYVIKKSI